jgi:beta-lactamase domain protein
LIKKGERPVRVGSLMGLEQVGQCIFIEYDKDLILVDAGMEFAAEAELGADYIIPDISYIKKNKVKLKGIVLTHGHLDHIGALRDILPELDFPMIYTTPLALGLIKKTFENPKDAMKIKYKLIDPDMDIIKLGCFTLEFARVNHNIPETLAVAIHTPKGVIFDSADFKIDQTPAIDQPSDLAKIARIGLEGVKLYIGDSLGSDRPGWSVSEKVIGKNLDDLIKNTQSRTIIATFASNVGRIIQIINSAIKYNKVVFLSGRSMVNNIEICQELGYINVPKGFIRKLSTEVDTLPDERVLILSTGAQGEEFAGLTRMARGDHPMVQLKPGDTVLMSASAIPGNEMAVSNMINDLIVKGVNVVTRDDIDIHASGHGFMEEHKLFLSLLKPEYFLPFFMPPAERYAHRKLAIDLGMDADHILMPHENGDVIEIYDEVTLIASQQIKLDKVVVDGKGIGHLSGEYVIKARKIMAESGIVGLIFKVDTKTRELVGNIQIESRGFVYSSEVKKIHTQIVEFARAKYNDNCKKRMDIKDNLKLIREELGEYITKIIGRVPMLMLMYVYINREAVQNIQVEPSDEIIGMTLEEQGYKD